MTEKFEVEAKNERISLEPEIKTKDKLEMKPEEEIHENNEEMMNLLN
jgi:hypothetical protein